MSAGPGTSRPGTRQGWTDLAAILVFAVMLAEMLAPVKSTTSVKALIVFIGICVWNGAWPLVSRGLALFALPAVAYLATACLNGLQYKLVLKDAVNVVQTGILIALIGAARFDKGRRERFYSNLHVTFMLLGLAGAVGGLIKLFLDSRGLQLPYLFDEAGRYPAGSSLQLDYNTFTMALILALSSALWLIPRTGSRAVLYLCHFGWPILVAALILTGSRRALMFLAAGLIVWIAGAIWKRRHRVQHGAGRKVSVSKWLLGLYCILLLSTALYAPPVRVSIADMMASPQVNALLDRSITLGNAADLFETRVGYWEYSTDELAGRDIVSLSIGEGFTYVSELGQVMGVEEDYPHNFVFSSMLYGGALQTLLLLLVIGIGFVRALRTTFSGRFLFFWLLVNALFLLSSSNSFFGSEMGLVILVLALDSPRQLPSPASSPSPGRQRYQVASRLGRPSVPA